MYVHPKLAFSAPIEDSNIKCAQLISLKGLALHVNTLSMVVLSHVGFVILSLDSLWFFG